MVERVVKGATDLINGILAERGFRAGVYGGFVTGVIFMIIYLLAGVKGFPIGLFSFAREILFLVTFILEGSIFGLIFGILYDFIPVDKTLNKSMVLALIVWILTKLVPFHSMLFGNYIIILETVARQLILAILIAVFWEELVSSNK